MGDVFTMKCLPECDRPYEKIERYGAETLSDSELLAVIIKTGTRKSNAVEVARRLLIKGENKGLCGISDMSLQELMQTDGIGRVKAVQLQAVFEIAKRIRKNGDAIKKKVSNVDALGEFLVADLAERKQEIFRTVLMDVHCQIIKMVDVSVGTVDCALVHPREVFSEAVRCACFAVILVHNHPSGDAKPSRADLRTTERLIISGEIIGINVADHIIVGNNSFYSMKKEGDLNKIMQKIQKDENNHL